MGVGSFRESHRAAGQSLPAQAHRTTPAKGTKAVPALGIGHLPGNGGRPRLGCHVSSPMEAGDQCPVMLLVRAWNGILGCGQGEGRPKWRYSSPGTQDWNIVKCLKTALEIPYHFSSVGSPSGWGWIWTPWACFHSSFSLSELGLS